MEPDADSAAEITAEEQALLDALSDRQHKFCIAFLGSARLNASKAAEIAGYSDPHAQAHRVRNHPAVATYIEYRLGQESLSSKEILARLSEQATLNIADFYTIGKTGKPIINLKRAEQAGLLHLIAGFEYSKTGALVVKFHDAQAALVHLGRNQKLFVDRTEHSGSIEFVEQAARTLNEKLLSPLAADPAAGVPQ